MMVRVLTLACCVAVLLIATSAQAALVNLSASIDGLQEVPSVATAGIGSATGTLDTVTGDITFSGSFSVLTGNTTMAHLHGPAAVGVNAGVMFALTIPIGVTSGTITGASTLTAGQVNDVLNGLTYINVHSSFKTGGEIRGQVVPEPATLAVGLAAATLLILRRRRA